MTTLRDICLELDVTYWQTWQEADWRVAMIVGCKERDITLFRVNKEVGYG